MDIKVQMNQNQDQAKGQTFSRNKIELLSYYDLNLTRRLTEQYSYRF